MSPGRQGGSVPFPSNAQSPTLQAPVLTLGIVTDEVSMSAELPPNSLPCIAPQSSNWEVYYSSYYQKNPTNDPDNWTGPESPDGDGALSADWTEMPIANYFITRCQTSAGWSPWSNVIPGSLNVSFTEPSGALDFVWSGNNPTGWRLVVWSSYDSWINSNASNYGDNSDQAFDIDGSLRTFDVSGISGQFEFMLVATHFPIGVDVEAARGVYG